MASNGFVCVINRNRDNYQVPLAIEEAGLLSAFVTDFYAPDTAPSWLPAVLRARHVDGLPARKTRSTASSFILQSVMIALKLPTRAILLISDRILARKALKEARRKAANLYCYASYVPREGEMPPGAKLLNFEFHPLPHLTFETLKADAAKYPEVALSFANEEDSLAREVVTDSWRRSDAIVCASRLTKRSLEHVGCDAARITVIPYGFRDRAELAPAQSRPGKGCRFLFVGQGIQRKGLHHLIRTWQALDLPDCELTLVCYHIDPGIKGLIAPNGSIRLLGRQSREQLGQLYAEADVFVMPSLVEGFGLVYLEAIEQGCHVIGTRDTGLPDLPVSAEAATIVDAGDLEALGRALQDLRQRKLAGKLDPVAIQAEIDNWTWRDFRKAIADHARAFLDRAAA